MVTKATRDVLDLAIRDVKDIKVNGSGNSNIDAVPIGTTTPDLGYFTNMKANSLEIAAGGSLTIGAGATVTGIDLKVEPAVTGTAVTEGMLVKSTDNPARLFFNATTASITPTGTTAAILSSNGLTEVVSDGTPIYGGMKAAALAMVVPNNVLVKTNDNLVYGNFTGADATITTGINGADLAVDGFTAVTATPTSVEHILDTAVSGNPVSPRELVMSSDGKVFVNATAASITPTGTIATILAGNGFTRVGPVGPIDDAAIGTGVDPKNMVLSSDGAIMINLGATAVTPTATTEASLTASGLVKVGPATGATAGLATVGTSTNDRDLIKSSDGFLFGNFTGAALSPTTGTTAAALETDGFQKIGPIGNIARDGAVALVVYPNEVIQSSDGYMMINDTASPITLTSGTTRANNLTDGLSDYYSTFFIPSNLGGTISPTGISPANGSALSVTFTSSNGTAPFTWSVSSGTLPTGLTLNTSTGALTGTPTDASGTAYSFKIKATDATGNYNEGTYTGNILGSDLGGDLNPATLAFKNGENVNQVMAATAGVAPYTYAVSAGALPNTLSLDSATGKITGSVTDAAGTAFSFTITATDSAGNFQDTVYSGTIAVGDGLANPSAAVGVGAGNITMASLNPVVLPGGYVFGIRISATAYVEDQLRIAQLNAGGITSTYLSTANAVKNYFYPNYIDGTVNKVIVSPSRQASGWQSINILDVSNPAAPNVILNSSSLPFEHRLSIYIQMEETGQYLLSTPAKTNAGSRKNSVIGVIDITNPSTPVYKAGLLGRMSYRYAGGAYLGNNHVLLNDGGRIINCDNPLVPYVVSVLPGYHSSALFTYHYVDGNTLLINNSFGGVDLYDISSLRDPKFLSSIMNNINNDLVAVRTDYSNSSATRSVKVGNYVYIGSGSDSLLRVYDVSDRTTPKLVFSGPSGSCYAGPWVYNQKAYVIDYNGNVTIYT